MSRHRKHRRMQLRPLVIKVELPNRQLVGIKEVLSRLKGVIRNLQMEQRRREVTRKRLTLLEVLRRVVVTIRSQVRRARMPLLGVTRSQTLRRQRMRAKTRLRMQLLKQMLPSLTPLSQMLPSQTLPSQMLPSQMRQSLTRRNPLINQLMLLQSELIIVIANR